MRIVTWNIQVARPNPDGPSAIEPLAEALRSIHADVYAIQELDRGRARSGRVDQPTALAEALGGNLAFAPTVRRGTAEYGIGIVTRGELRTTEVVPLSGTREPRALLVAEIALDGRQWTVGCTHLSRNRAFAQRQLLRVLDALSARPAPRVLVGDLNLLPGEVLPWSTAEGFQLLDGPPTHSTRQTRLTRRIDHVLLSGTTAETVTVHRLPFSDHCAVSADLR